MAPPYDHDCAWKEQAAALQKKLDEMLEAQKRQQEELEALKRQAFSKKSEKMPPMDREVRRDKDDAAAEARRKRKENAVAKTRLIAETVESKVPDSERKCTKCGREDGRVRKLV